MKEKDYIERTPIIEECKHTIEIRYNDERKEYVTYCSECGQILDIIVVEPTSINNNSTKIGFYKKYRRKKRMDR